MFLLLLRILTGNPLIARIIYPSQSLISVRVCGANRAYDQLIQRVAWIDAHQLFAGLVRHDILFLHIVTDDLIQIFHDSHLRL